MQLPPVGKLSWMIIESLPRVLFDPGYALFFWLVVAFVYFQYRRTQATEESLFGQVLNPAVSNTLTAVMYGLVGGIAGSFVFVFMGATLSGDDIRYVWPLALALMLVNPRLICFSYAGGIIAISSTLFGWPAVNVPGLMALVAILHVVEGLLVRVSGAQCASPVFVRHRGKTVGGFTLQRFWPIPITIILALALPDQLAGGGVDMPDWWPLIPPLGGRELIDTLSFVMFPAVAALGYGDLAITCPPERKSRHAASQLVIFSSVLLVLALLAVKWPMVGLLAGLFSAGGHETMSQLGSRREMNGQPYFSSPKRGIRVLEVLPDSLAEQLGLRSGDIILEVNGTPVNTPDEFKSVLLEASFYLELKTETRGGIVIREYNRYSGRGANIGLILVPEDDSEAHMELKPMGLLESIFGRWYRRRAS